MIPLFLANPFKRPPVHLDVHNHFHLSLHIQAAHGLELESVLARRALPVSSQPGGQAATAGVSAQQTVPQSSVSVSHCHGSGGQRLFISLFTAAFIIKVFFILRRLLS